MKDKLRLVFSSLLGRLEAGDEPFAYKPLQRKVLIFIGCLFTGLAVLVVIFGQGKDLGYLLPVVVFGSAGILALIVGLLGNDRAVAKIWGSR